MGTAILLGLVTVMLGLLVYLWRAIQFNAKR